MPVKTHDSHANSALVPSACDRLRSVDFLIGMLPLLLVTNLFLWITFLPLALHGHSDFRQLYVAGYMARSGYFHRLYDYNLQRKLQDQLVIHEELPFNHLAAEALLFAPLSLFPYKQAYLIFIFLNCVFLFASCCILQPHLVTLRQHWRFLPLTLFLSFLPVHIALIQGQDSILLLLILASSCSLLCKRLDLPAGMVAGLGLFKFQIGLPLAAFLVLRRQWRFCSGFTISAALMAALSTALVGVKQSYVYVHSLSGMSFGLDSKAAQLQYGIYPGNMANLRGLIYGLTVGMWPNTSIQIATLLVSTLILILVVCAVGPKVSSIRATALGIVLATFLSYHILPHDLSVLLIPIALSLEWAVSAERRGPGLLWSALTAYFVPLSLLLVPHHFYFASLSIALFLATLVAAGRERWLTGEETI